jgi:energy-coupling factor transport system permease protein
VLAVAMEARGFGVDRHRTWARPSRFGPGDLAIAVGGLLIAVLATVAGVVTGSWNLVLS